MQDFRLKQASIEELEAENRVIVPDLPLRQVSVEELERGNRVILSQLCHLSR